jgi:hypothetical protein
MSRERDMGCREGWWWWRSRFPSGMTKGAEGAAVVVGVRLA